MPKKILGMKTLTEEEYEAIPEVGAARELEKLCRIDNIRQEINKRLNELRLLYAELVGLGN